MDPGPDPHRTCNEIHSNGNSLIQPIVPEFVSTARVLLYISSRRSILIVHSRQRSGASPAASPLHVRVYRRPQTSTRSDHDHAPCFLSATFTCCLPGSLSSSSTSNKKVMAPTTKRMKNIKVHVARHNSQRIGPALTAKVGELAKEQKLRADLRQPTNEPSSTIAQAIVCFI